jgi:hypothetical protein
MKVLVDVSGGLDICFAGKKEMVLEFEDNSIKLKEVISKMQLMCIPDKLDFFVINNVM